MLKEQTPKEIYFGAFGTTVSFDNNATDDILLKMAQDDGVYQKLGYETIIDKWTRESTRYVKSHIPVLVNKAYNKAIWVIKARHGYENKIREAYNNALIGYRTFMRGGVPFEKYDYVAWCDPKTSEQCEGAVVVVAKNSILVRNSLNPSKEGREVNVPMTYKIKIVKKLTPAERKDREKVEKEIMCGKLKAVG
jgi:hypothetical protein